MGHLWTRPFQGVCLSLSSPLFAHLAFGLHLLWSRTSLPSSELMSALPFVGCSEESGGGAQGFGMVPLILRLLESWKDSTQDRVPEKTNSRSWLIWENVRVYRGSF